jgi:hypothetical protein
MKSEEPMKRTIIATTLALALSTTFAVAQSSQGQAGANTGPTSNSAVNQNNGTTANGMNRDSKMDRSGMTTGSSTGRTTGNSAGTGNNNGNSMGGSNSSANPSNSAGSGSGSAGMK